MSERPGRRSCLTRVQVRDPSHRQARQVRDRDPTRPGHRDRQRPDRGQLVHHHQQHPPTHLQLLEQLHQIGFSVRQWTVHQPVARSIQRDRIVHLAGHVDPAEHLEPNLTGGSRPSSRDCERRNAAKEPTRRAMVQLPPHNAKMLGERHRPGGGEVGRGELPSRGKVGRCLAFFESFRSDLIVRGDYVGTAADFASTSLTIVGSVSGSVGSKRFAQRWGPLHGVIAKVPDGSGA